MQNKANLRKAQMNASSAITMNYEQLTMNYANKNKPNSKPIKPNFYQKSGKTCAFGAKNLAFMAIAGQCTFDSELISGRLHLFIQSAKILLAPLETFRYLKIYLADCLALTGLAKFCVARQNAGVT